MRPLPKFTTHPLLEVSGVAVVIAVVLSLLFSVGFYSNLELALSDNLYGGGKPLNAVVIVAIDDKSIQEIGRWPWDRKVFAEALPKLNQSKVIGM
ncbi:MAG: CHASE2 domain-containing protein, partial [Nanoarchaeota archaeon]|nr:CHASE2 domain-containing protein [Nanoarchaeota archaeon]